MSTFKRKYGVELPFFYLTDQSYNMFEKFSKSDIFVSCRKIKQADAPQFYELPKEMKPQENNNYKKRRDLNKTRILEKKAVYLPKRTSGQDIRGRS